MPTQTPNSRGWLLWGGILVAAGLAIGFWIGNRHGQATAEAAAVTAKAQSATASAHRELVSPDPNPNPARSPTSVPLVKIDIDHLRRTLMRIASISNIWTRIVAMRQLMEALPEKRWGEALREVDAISVLQRSTPVRDAVYEYVASRGPADCLSEMLDRRENGSLDRVVPLLSAWAARDLPGSLAFFDARLKGDADLAKISASVLVDQYARIDADAALQWISTLPDGFSKDLPRSAILALSDSNPEAAAHMYEAVPELHRSPFDANYIVWGWEKTDPEAAFKWAARRPAGQTERGKKDSLVQWARTDIGKALQGVAELPVEARDSLLETLVEGAKTDGDLGRVMAFIQTQPEGEGRAWAAYHAMRRWAETSREAASEWLNRQPVGHTRDEAIAGFAEAIGGNDPGAAAEWRATINDANVRQAQLEDGIIYWIDKAPEAARAWVMDSPKLTAEDREVLQKITGR